MLKENAKSRGIFIGKSVFFPKRKILVIGDLHLGYERMLFSHGFSLPFNQLEETKRDFEEIIKKIGKSKIKTVVFLGDLKHHFSFEKNELKELKEFLEFVKKSLPKRKIILIEGNHDKIKLPEWEYFKYYIDNDLAFVHGNIKYKEIFQKGINTILMSHLHPAVSIQDPHGIKKEKYKCFLIGRYKQKDIIVLPSFFPIIEGSEIDFYKKKNKKEFSIIPNNKLLNFETFVVGKSKVYRFGKYEKFK